MENLKFNISHPKSLSKALFQLAIFWEGKLAVKLLIPANLELLGANAPRPMLRLVPS